MLVLLHVVVIYLCWLLFRYGGLWEGDLCRPGLLHLLRQIVGDFLLRSISVRTLAAPTE